MRLRRSISRMLYSCKLELNWGSPAQARPGPCRYGELQACTASQCSSRHAAAFLLFGQVVLCAQCNSGALLALSATGKPLARHRQPQASAEPAVQGMIAGRMGPYSYNSACPCSQSPLNLTAPHQLIARDPPSAEALLRQDAQEAKFSNKHLNLRIWGSGAVPAIAVTITWVTCQNTAWAWVLQDCLGMSLMALILRQFRLPSVQVRNSLTAQGSATSFQQGHGRRG